MMIKIGKIIRESIPVLIMIGLIPLISNDYMLSAAYIAVIVISFMLKREKNDFLLLAFGFFAMIISETIFISTGVEVFLRNSLFGLMPLWLPILWAYSFVAIKRSIKIIEV